MDPDALAAMMAQMGMTFDDLREMQARLGMSSDPPSQASRPPHFRPDMSAEELDRGVQAYQAWFEEDRKVPPGPAPSIDPKELISRQLELRQGDGQTSRGEVLTYMTIVGFPKHSSSTPLSKLKRITFADMLIRKAHIGHYLVCRIVAPCVLRYVDSLFPIGTIMAIREPTLKAATQGPYPLVRVDSPTDIVFLDPTSPILSEIAWKRGPKVSNSPIMPTTVEEWQKRGNADFKISEWLPAAIAYSHGLELDCNAAVLRVNRAEAFLRLKYYSGALFDAQHAYTSPEVPETSRDKALFRAARANYGREDFKAAETMFLQWQRTHPEDRAVVEWISRSRARLAESGSGKYDWAHMFRTSQKNVHLDVADYVGPIEVRPMQHRGGGRGVVATRDIKLGELLLVSKPFVSVFPQDVAEREIFMSVDLITKSMNRSTQSITLLRAVEKLYGNPDAYDSVYDLYAGPDYPSPPTSYPPPVPKGPTPVDPLASTVDIDIARLEAICAYNNFSPVSLHPLGLTSSAKKDEPPTGLYLLPALLNHSCAGNATWHCFGDVMVIRAVQPIQAGTEITHHYTADASYVDRCASLKKHMLSSCDCWLCKEDLGDGEDAIQRRHALYSQFMGGDAHRYSLTKLRALEKELYSTYAESRGPIRPMTAAFLFAIANRLRSSGAQRDAIGEEIQALKNLGFKVLNGTGSSSLNGDRQLPIETDNIPSTTPFQEPVASMIRIAKGYMELEDKKKAGSWLRASLWVLDVVVGGGRELYILIMGPTLEKLNMLKFAKKVL
ncbi:hypothetical protein A0H81_03834 [Grifola frondosa]|uniref:SET domain-containing protein n=1 Tax=Grifola frondosa TaxID=5627 RepID=A0A1C7MIK7_GRIFR|nr:hypothetical protein A0H81_03834 [Grifola frondosa]